MTLLKPPINARAPVTITSEAIAIVNGIARLQCNPATTPNMTVTVGGTTYAATSGTPGANQYKIMTYTPSGGSAVNLPLLQFASGLNATGSVTYDGTGTSVTAEFFADLVAFLTPLTVATVGDLPAATTDLYTRGRNGDTATVGGTDFYVSDGTTWTQISGGASSDTIPPTVTAFTVGSPNDLTVNVTSFTASDAVGVIGYIITESVTPPTLLNPGWLGSAPSSYAASSAGQKTLYPWARDAAGNISLTFGSPRTVTFTSSDSTAPVVTGFTAGTVTNMSVAVSITGTDAVGVTRWACVDVASGGTPVAPDLATFTAITPATNANISGNYTASTAGVRDVYAYLADAAGNISAVSSVQQKTFTAVWHIVASQPTHGAISPAGSTAVTNGSSQAYTITPDTGYSITSLTIDGGTVADTDGSYTFTGVTADHTIAAVIADTTAPTISVFSAGTVSGANVPITFTATDGVGVTGWIIIQGTTQPATPADNDAGWLTSAPTSYTATSRDLVNLYAWAKDSAGNISAVATITGVDFRPAKGAQFAPTAMTAANAPSPFVVSASSNYSGFPGYFAFISGTSTWLGQGGGTDWLKLDIGTGQSKIPYSYSFAYHGGNGTRIPKSWTFEGSNNNSTWDVLDTVINETTWVVDTPKEFVCDTFATAYRYFRLNITANNGDSTYIAVSNMLIYQVA